MMIMTNYGINMSLYKNNRLFINKLYGLKLKMFNKLMNNDGILFYITKPSIFNYKFVSMNDDLKIIDNHLSAGYAYISNDGIINYSTQNRRYDFIFIDHFESF